MLCCPLLPHWSGPLHQHLIFVNFLSHHWTSMCAVLLRTSYTQNHGFHTSLLYWSPYLFPRLNLANLPHPNFFFLNSTFLSTAPSAQCWVAMVESSSSFSTSMPCASMNRSCAFLPLTAAIDLLNFEPFSGMHFPRSWWHHARSWLLLDVHLHVALLESLFLLDNREPLLALFTLQPLDSCAQIFFLTFQHAITQSHSFSTALTQLTLHESTRRNPLALSFLSVFNEGDSETFGLYFFLQLFHHPNASGNTDLGKIAVMTAHILRVAHASGAQ